MPVNDWSPTTVVAVAAALVALALLVLVVVLTVGSRRTRAELAATRAAQADLAERVEALGRPVPGQHPAVEIAEFVITDVGAGDEQQASAAPEAPGRIEGRLFVDIVARETVVKAASWTYGMRRALSAENRNRVRFEVRRETRRAQRRRKADVKEALRQYYARQERAGQQDDVA